MTKDDKIVTFYKWLEKHEFQFRKEHNVNSATVVQSIKSMYKDVFDL